jgi:two-component system chemotaxis response regulator CheB
MAIARLGEPMDTAAHPSGVVPLNPDAATEPRESPSSADLREPTIIAVVGASAGGVSALTTLLNRIPGDFRGALFIVLHSAPESPARLPAILARKSALEVAHPRDGEPIRAGRVYVAPPNRHLVVRPGHVHLSTGPRENGSRPSIDALFRSAALEYGPRTVGVVLTGTLDDGTAGLLAIEEAGGVTVVQDPDEAAFPEMPENAATYVTVSHMLPLAGIAKLLTELSASSEVSPAEPPHTLAPAEAPLRLGEAWGLSCPECDGSLWNVSLGELMEYRCQIGHRYSPESLAFHMSERGDQIAQSALRSLEQQAVLADLLSERAAEAGRSGRSGVYRRRAHRMRRRIAALRELLGQEIE